MVRLGFSLAELIVSMGILLLMLALAGQVFNLTVHSTGQATALTEVMQELRVFEQTLREDLRGVQPGSSLILIQGNPVNAYWTRDGRDADDDPTAGGPATGYPHAADPEREAADGTLLLPPRADILMIFTARRGNSFAEAATSGVTSNLQQVVYGHAELGDYVVSDKATGGYEFQSATGDAEGDDNNVDDDFFPTDMERGARYPSTKKVAKVPAEQWHLARRSVLLLPAVVNVPTPPTQPITALSDDSLRDGKADVVGNFAYDKRVLRPWLNPATLDYQWPWCLPEVFGDVTKPQWLGTVARSLLDPTPPPVRASRLGHYMLPRCASFKVEWALNPRSEFVAGRLDGAGEGFWFDPGWPGDPTLEADDPCRAADPLCQLARRVRDLKKGGTTCPGNDPSYALCRSLDSLNDINHRSFHPDPGQGGNGLYSLSDRFRGPNFPGNDPNYTWDQLAPDGKRPNLVVFAGTRPSVSGSEPAPDDMFPGALRVTIDVFDKDRRLDRPIRHVMVIPIGG